MRHIQQNQNYNIAYGRDHIFGLFIQVFERAKANDEDEGLIIDLDQHRHQLTAERMVEIAEEYGFNIGSIEHTIS